MIDAELKCDRCGKPMRDQRQLSAHLYGAKDGELSAGCRVHLDEVWLQENGYKAIPGPDNDLYLEASVQPKYVRTSAGAKLAVPAALVDVRMMVGVVCDYDEIRAYVAAVLIKIESEPSFADQVSAVCRLLNQFEHASLFISWLESKGVEV